ncbi:sulfate adenylyltransferase subunit CysN [Shewanella sp. NIFS-20-20]|uniref:sulfate adenylyltransferase subunit CysN n=1 Tax=Shewanella sp. NIFS-20-20 TaxID=2853806 RepID=UPI001C4399D4|nr:sulfate adenylyltransferase subunit CysN [Shewanella sp. NIFS-20-20]MBV7315855.1 sulfate adenylyltransferase subunit CysN [Shewanella sp. NIFS-20-20]
MNNTQQYIQQQQHKSLLRLLTCGSVDDGKSTLIGRLLYDSTQIYEDQLASLKSDSAKLGTTGDTLDLALLVDGLQAEREQGITIDVAYRYFSTKKRKFIIADTPGHEQYTRNMATGASTCELAVVLIDARYGVQSQTRRHALIASLLGIKHLVVAINKMDLVDYSQSRYQQIVAGVDEFAASLGELNIDYVPVSALVGDNVVNPSQHMPWYQGESLLSLLENVDTRTSLRTEPVRMAVQYVQRPNLDFRGYAGTLQSGTLSVGDELVVYPSGKRSTVARIVTFDGDLPLAVAGQAITLTLNDELDISRGDLLAGVEAPPQLAREIRADLVWMDEAPLVLGKLYDVKVGHKLIQASVTAIDYQLDVNSYQQQAASSLALNSIARVSLSLSETIAFDPYQQLRHSGSLIVIDRLTNATVAAAMLVAPIEGAAKPQFSDFERQLNALIRQQYPHWQAIDITTLES